MSSVVVIGHSWDIRMRRQTDYSSSASRAVLTVITIRNGKHVTDVRHYILSRFCSGRKFAEAVRHWEIENNLHWQLDVTFGEDQSRIRMGHADTNFSSLPRTALSLLKCETTGKVGIKNKRLMAGWDDEYLTKVVFGQ